MTDAFNPELFLQTTVTDAFKTELVPVPEGEYLAVSGPISAKSFRSYDIKNGPRAGEKGYSLDLEWTLDDSSGDLKKLLGREAKVRQSMMLSMSSDGVLSKDQNQGLARLREALGQNANGKPWNFAMLGGQMARVKVKHRIVDDKVYAEVSEVARAG